MTVISEPTRVGVSYRSYPPIILKPIEPNPEFRDKESPTLWKALLVFYGAVGAMFGVLIALLHKRTKNPLKGIRPPEYDPFRTGRKLKLWG